MWYLINEQKEIEKKKYVGSKKDMFETYKCPNCGCEEIRVKVELCMEYNLNAIEDFMLGIKAYDFAPSDNDIVTCEECGWRGIFKDIVCEK